MDDGRTTQRVWLRSLLFLCHLGTKRVSLLTMSQSPHSVILYIYLSCVFVWFYTIFLPDLSLPVCNVHDPYNAKHLIIIQAEINSQMNTHHVPSLEATGVHVCSWDRGGIGTREHPKKNKAFSTEAKHLCNKCSFVL